MLCLGPYSLGISYFLGSLASCPPSARSRNYKFSQLLVCGVAFGMISISRRGFLGLLVSEDHVVTVLRVMGF